MAADGMASPPASVNSVAASAGASAALGKRLLTFTEDFEGAAIAGGGKKTRKRIQASMGAREYYAPWRVGTLTVG